MRKPNDVLLDRFEESINQLKVEYEIFFNGGTDVLPEKMHNAINLELKRLYNIQSFTYAQGFRLNSLASRLNAHNDSWKRNLRLIEQGGRTRGGK